MQNEECMFLVVYHAHIVTEKEFVLLQFCLFTNDVKAAVAYRCDSHGMMNVKNNGNSYNR